MRIIPKRLLWFSPLLLGFLLLGLLILDLKHPAVSQDTCLWIGRGAGVSKFITKAQMLYQHSGKVQDNIGLQCHVLGNVWLNDDLPLPAQPQQKITLTRKAYRWVPTRYYLSVPVVNPTNG